MKIIQIAGRAANKSKWEQIIAALSAVLVVAVAIPEVTAVAIPEAAARSQGQMYKLTRRALAPQRSGCTAQQVSDADSRLEACYRAQENDLSNNSPSTHYVFCSNGGRSCCQVDNRTGATSNCVRIDKTVKSRDAANPIKPPVGRGP